MNDDKIYRVLVVEDELPARELLLEYIMGRDCLKLAGIAKNGKDALEKLQNNEMNAEKYDLLLLDVNLPVYSGIEVLTKIKNHPYIIFTTAYDQYAMKAFDMGAVDYLLKPYSIERFNRAIDKFLVIKKNKQPFNYTPHDFSLSFKEKDKHYIVAYDDIIYISSHSKHSIIHTKEKDFEVSKILKVIEQKLPLNIFMRIHKQYVVNLQYISNIKYYIGGQYISYLNDEDETSLPVGRSFAASLKGKLKIS